LLCSMNSSKHYVTNDIEEGVSQIVISSSFYSALSENKYECLINNKYCLDCVAEKCVKHISEGYFLFGQF